MKPYTLHTGKSEIVLRDYPDNFFDSCVTDSPYGLRFMGKAWDNFDIQDTLAKNSPNQEGRDKTGLAMSAGKYDLSPKAMIRFQEWFRGISAEIFRVLKPGGYFTNFAAPRTYHRMACAVEEAGFEIRDQIFWVFSSGFPKSYNATAWELHLKSANLFHLEKVTDLPGGITNSQGYSARTFADPQHPLLFVQGTYLQTPVYSCACCSRVLQPYVPSGVDQTTETHREAWSKSETCWSEESIMERWSNTEKREGELQRCQVCQMSHGIFANGAEGWVRNGAPIGHGKEYWKIVDEEGGSASFRSRSFEQHDQQLKTLLLECRAQAVRGYGTALKPAHEPIVIARKPLTGTVIQNFEKWGVGGINIDACRIEGEPWSYGSQVKLNGGNYKPGQPLTDEKHAHNIVGGDNGRWPANLIHDGSNEVLKLFPYFYCAKTSQADRNEGLPEGMVNDHPTVKPTDLMRYITRLVTPKGGKVLDPFRGSGSIGKAAIFEWMEYHGIDEDEKWDEISRYRIEYAINNRDGQIPLFDADR